MSDKEVGKLKAKNKILAEQLHDYMARIDELKWEVKALEERLEVALDDVAFYMTKIAELESENAELKLTLSGKTFSYKLESKDD